MQISVFPRIYGLPETSHSGDTSLLCVQRVYLLISAARLLIVDIRENRIPKCGLLNYQAIDTALRYML